jgi:hypothetical protein
LSFVRTSNDVLSVAPSRGSSKTRPKRPSNNSNSGTGIGRQSSQGGLRKKRPSSRRHQEKPARSSTTTSTSTTSTTPAYNYPHTTPEPPTTPDPGSGKVKNRSWLTFLYRRADELSSQKLRTCDLQTLESSGAPYRNFEPPSLFSGQISSVKTRDSSPILGTARSTFGVLTAVHPTWVLWRTNLPVPQVTADVLFPYLLQLILQ